MNAQHASDAITVYGLTPLAKGQKPLIDKHCFGDCGRVSMAGAINDEQLGPMWVCCEASCPWLLYESAKPVGTTMSFGREHRVFVRLLTDSPEPNAAAHAAAGSCDSGTTPLTPETGWTEEEEEAFRDMAARTPAPAQPATGTGSGQ